MNIYLDLFLTFFRIGGLTFGGGYAMLPMLQREVAEKKGWATEAELMDFYAIGQCLPGIIAVNTAIFIGNKVKRERGGIAAALGVVCPSLLIIMVIAAFISGFADMPAVKSAFAGIRVCVCVLIVNALLKLRKGALVDTATVLLCAATFLLSLFLNVTPIVYIIAAGIAGILLKGGKVAKQ